MPNRDPNNKNMSIAVSDEFKKRILKFIDTQNKRNSLALGKMTVRSLLVKAGYEFMQKTGGTNGDK